MESNSRPISHIQAGDNVGCILHCTFCLQHFDNKHDFLEHTALYHRSGCESDVDTDTKLNINKITECDSFEKKPDSCTKDTFSYYNSNMQFQIKQDLTDNLKPIDSNREFLCFHCGWNGSSSEDLLNHQKEEHEQTDNKSFNNKFLEGNAFHIDDTNEEDSTTCDDDFEIELKNSLDNLIVNLGDRLQCRFCNKCFSLHKPSITRHMSKNHAESFNENTQCSVCKMYFTDNTALETHYQTNHSDTLIFDVDQYKSMLFDENIAMIVSDDSGKVQCRICEKVLGRKPDLRRHIRKLHYNTQNITDFEKLKRGAALIKITAKTSKKRKSPEICQSSVTEVVKETDLTTTVNPDGTPQSSKSSKLSAKKLDKLKCHLCNKTFGCKGSLSKHLKQKHITTMQEDSKNVNNLNSLDIKESDTTGKTKCPDCDKYFSKKSVLVRHHKTIHLKLATAKRFITKKVAPGANCTKSTGHQSSSNKEFICQRCNHSETSKIDMRRHMKTHYYEDKKSKDPSICHECGKVYNDERSLRYHLVHVHAQVKDFACHFCGRRFSVKQNLIDHLRTHNDERPAVCNVCGKTFKTTRVLTIHNRVHTNYYKFTCAVCGVKLRTRQHYDNHMVVHTGIRNFACDVCAKSFATKERLRIHKELHIDEFPFQCDLCSSTFKVKRYLDNHFRKVHNKKCGTEQNTVTA